MSEEIKTEEKKVEQVEQKLEPKVEPKLEPKVEAKKLAASDVVDYEKATVAELGEEKHKLLKEVMTKKAKLQEMADENDRLQKALEEIRKTELEKQGEWQQLYEQEKERANILETGILEREQKMLDVHKMHAVTEHLRFKKPEYMTFIDKKSIVMDEHGKIETDSLQAEVDRVKQFHAELLDSDRKSNLPNNAPDGKEPVKNMADMSKDELIKSIMKSGKF